jgi:pectin methylesterase-like acyl-CoA thioesterase
MLQAKSTFGFWKSVPFLIAVCCVPLACSSPTVSGSGGGSGGSANGGATTTGGSVTTPGGGGGTNVAGATGTGGAGGSAAGSGSGGGVSSTGGSSGLGGAGGSRSSSGGSTGGGGAISAGGSTSADGSAGREGGANSGQTGGNTGIGTATGGKVGSGGTTSTGGRSSTGGTVATGGSSSTGGATGTGGKVGSGGSTVTGGTTGTGGSTGGPAVCPAGITQTITVAKDGSGQFTTVQAAVNSIGSGSSTHTRIDIKAGTYTEKLTIASRTNLCLVGASPTTTILSYGDSNGSVGSTSGSASVLISANDFSAANLTIENTYGSGSQAVALRTTGDRQQFLNCRFVGYQDTLYTHQGSQYFRDCYVQGNTDYVFGGATAVLQNCEVRNVEGGSATSAPNTDIGTAYGIVFLGGKFTAVSAVKTNSVALARPWGADGFAAFLNADLGAHIAAAGFVAMSGNQPQNARLHEYGSTGNGANTSSRTSYQLSASQAASYTLANIFGSWTPTYSQ